MQASFLQRDAPHISLTSALAAYGPAVLSSLAPPDSRVSRSTQRSTLHASGQSTTSGTRPTFGACRTTPPPLHPLTLARPAPLSSLAQPLPHTLAPALLRGCPAFLADGRPVRALEIPTAVELQACDGPGLLLSNASALPSQHACLSQHACPSMPVPACLSQHACLLTADEWMAANRDRPRAKGIPNKFALWSARTDDSVFGSDHLPVVVEFEWPLA